MAIMASGIVRGRVRTYDGGNDNEDGIEQHGGHKPNRG